MTTRIEFDRDRARAFVQDHGMWPATGRPENTIAQEWWLRVLERVTDAANAHDWHQEDYPDDRCTELAEAAVAKQVEQARGERFILTLCELSAVDRELPDPFECGVYSRMTSPVVELSCKGLFGGPYEDPDKADARRERHARVSKLLSLGSVAEAYLSAAADEIARGWCAGLVTQWQDANPED